jgi:hypothetical protein
MLAANLASADARIGPWRTFNGSVLLRAAAHPLSAGFAGSCSDRDYTVIAIEAWKHMTDRQDHDTDYYIDKSHIALP